MDSPEYMAEEIKHLRAEVEDLKKRLVSSAEHDVRERRKLYQEIARLNGIIAKSEDSMAGIPEYEEGNTVKPGFEIEPIRRKK